MTQDAIKWTTKEFPYDNSVGIAGEYGGKAHAVRIKNSGDQAADIAEGKRANLEWFREKFPGDEALNG